MGCKITSQINLLNIPQSQLSPLEINRIFYNNPDIHKTQTGNSLFLRTLQRNPPDEDGRLRRFYGTQRKPGVSISSDIFNFNPLINIPKIESVRVTEKGDVSNTEIHFLEETYEIAGGIFFLRKITTPEANKGIFERISFSLALLVDVRFRGAKIFPEFIRDNILTEVLALTAANNFLELLGKKETLDCFTKQEETKPECLYGTYELVTKSFEEREANFSSSKKIKV